MHSSRPPYSASQVRVVVDIRRTGSGSTSRAGTRAACLLLRDDSADVAGEGHGLAGGEYGGFDVDLWVAGRVVDAGHGDDVAVFVSAYVEDGFERDAEPCGDAADKRVRFAPGLVVVGAGPPGHDRCPGQATMSFGSIPAARIRVAAAASTGPLASTCRGANLSGTTPILRSRSGRRPERFTAVSG